jgi:hypothetical protein
MVSLSNHVGQKLTMEKTPQELYQEREKRLLDVIALKKPDRVPIVFRPVLGHDL